MSIYDKLIRELCRRASPLTEKLGFVLSPVHFYYPIPSVKQLRERQVWDTQTSMAGIDWNLDHQVQFLQVLRPYAAECDWPEQRVAADGTYGWNASTFGFTSAMFAHTFVRHFKPRKIIEVGCGWSTTILLGAAEINRQHGQPAVIYSGIEPYPPAYLEKVAGAERLQKMPVQNVALEKLTELDEGDILFIDSSHGLSIGSDVQ